MFLAVTGAEALYADMGHFGRKPIQFAWLFFVLPALLLNYLGQGALVIHDPAAVKDPFYLMVPGWALIPFVILSTLATVIASQAVITGAFSLIRQAIQMGLLPRMEILHTSETTEGQIFVPRANRMMLVGVLLLVFLFKSSDALANAYGIAVTGTMVVTTSLAYFVVTKLWRWPKLWAVPLHRLLPLHRRGLPARQLRQGAGRRLGAAAAGLASMLLMWTWVRGTALLAAKTHRDSISTRGLIAMLAKSKPVRVPGTAIFLTSDPEIAPSSLMHNLKHNKVLHDRIVIMSVKTVDAPRVSPANRYRIEPMSRQLHRHHAELRLHGDPPHAGRPGDAAQGGAEVRHHDDVLLPRPAHPQGVEPLLHAEVAGPPVHRPVEAGRHRDGLLLHPVGPRGGAGRPGLGLTVAADAKRPGAGDTRPGLFVRTPRAVQLDACDTL